MEKNQKKKATGKFWKQGKALHGWKEMNVHVFSTMYLNMVSDWLDRILSLYLVQYLQYTILKRTVTFE